MDQAGKSEFVGQISRAESSRFVSLMWDYHVTHIYRVKRQTKDQRRTLTLLLHVLSLLCKASNIVIRS